MGKNTFTVTINETGESKSCTINVLEPEFVKGYWTNDEKGTTILKEAKLGDTVYFQVDTKGLANNQEIILKLREQDKNIFMIDWVDPDDKKFPEEEVVKKAIIIDDKATVKLVLQESWESMIEDDSDNAFSLDHKLELYWEASYGWRKAELPNKDDNYLRVGFSNRTLYFKTPIATHNLPEFISYDGDPMLLMEFGIGFLGTKSKDKALDLFAKKSNEQIKKIAFTKLKKGYMVDNQGKVYTGKRLIYEYKQIYTNSGEVFENVKQGKKFGYNHGASQYDYFSKNGKRVKLLGMVKNIGNVFDIFNFITTAGEDLDTSAPLPLDFGPLSPIADLAGVLVQEQKAEMDMWLEEEVQAEIDEAKLQGLEATRKVVEAWNHNKGPSLNFNWDFLPISSKTASKLIQGEFSTFEELEIYERDLLTGEIPKIEILYREQKNPNKDNQLIHLIESIFIDE